MASSLIKKAGSVYRFYNSAGNILYIGSSICPITRLKNHKQVKSWFAEIRTITITPYKTRAAALNAERIAIREESPPYNVLVLPSSRLTKLSTSQAKTANRVTLKNGPWVPVATVALSQQCKYCGRPCKGGGRVNHQKACLVRRGRIQADREFWT